MPTLEETLSNIASEVSQISSDLSEIGNATTIKSGLVKISDNNTPDDNSVPTVAFLKERNIISESGEAGGGLPQTQLEQVAALPATEILNALATLPENLSALAGRIIAVNSAGNGYEIIVAPSGGGGGGGGSEILPVSIAINRFTGNGTTTQFTLSQTPANANALDITISGISIDPAIYSVSGTTLTFTDAPPVTETNGIVVRHLGTVAALADGSIVTIKVADRAITLAKIANGTPGKFLKFNASTGVIEETDVVATVADNSIGTAKIINKNVTLAKIADGTPGKFLKFNSSTGVIEEADTVTGTAALVLLNTQIASGSASISFSSTYLTSAYKHYIIIYSGVYGTIPPANYLYLTTSANNGASYSTSGYTWSGQWQNPGSGTINGAGVSNDSKVDLTIQSGNFSNSASSPASGTINLFDITTAGVSVPTFMMEYNDFAFVVTGGGSIPAGPINNIKIAPPSGTITGTFKLYGVL